MEHTIGLSVEVIDAELRMQGTSLAAWTAARGLHPLDVVTALDGYPARAGALVELAEALGVAPEALRRAAPV